MTLVLMGLCCRSDNLGVTSFVRVLSLRGVAYHRFLHLFHSKALDLDILTSCWVRLCLALFRPFQVGTRLVCLADGIKAPKEGKRMPGVKLLHQESQNNTKPEYIMGHSFQAISLLVHCAGGQVAAVPLTSRIHEGLVFSNRDSKTLLDKLVALLLSITLICNRPVVLVADAYYASGKVITPLLKNAHTLDIAAALFQWYGLSKEVLHDRDIGPLVHKRFEAGVQIRENAFVWSAESLARFKPQAKPPTALSRSQRLDKTLVDWLKRCRDGEPAMAVLPEGITLKGLQNWFSPRQAVKLQERLLAASDKLTDDDINLLSRLGRTYWQASPPMFWFSEERCKGSSDPELTMVNDAVALSKLIRQCGFDADDFVTWRYAKADEKSHKKLWRKTLASAGLTSQPELRSGRSSNAKCLGISLRAGNVKRTVLLSVWLLALKHGCDLPEGPQ